MNARKPPNLQDLVVIAGAYGTITLAEWAQFDRAMDEWQAARRGTLSSNPIDPDLDILAGAGWPEQGWPYERCGTCGAEARFGYRDSRGALRWFCTAHRLARTWADARRGVTL
jgi:hypothetical protein